MKWMRMTTGTWRATALGLACALWLVGCSGAQENHDGGGDDHSPNAMDNSSMDNNTDDNADPNSDPEPPAAYEGLVINEVAASGEPNDWFELYNTSDQAIDLAGCTWADDLGDPGKASFDDGVTIAPGEYLVIDVTDDDEGFGIGSDEELAVYAPDDSIIDSTDWDEGDSPEGGSYGRSPDGDGPFAVLTSATRGEANQTPDDPNNSMTGGAECGDGAIEGEEECDGDMLGDATCASLGFAGGALACDSICLLDTSGCQAPAPDVVLNEVTSDGDDQIELYNNTDQAVDLAGWFVADDKYPTEADSRYVFEAGASIEAGGFVVLTKDVEHTFGVGKDDTITLYDADEMIVDQVAIPDGDAETSYCRATDGTGDFKACGMRSFGEPNTP